MDAFFTYIPTGSQGAIGGTSTEAPALVDAKALNVPKVLADSFLAAQKQGGTIRGEVVRQNKNGTLSVRTADGDIDIKIQTSNSSMQNKTTKRESQLQSQNYIAASQNFKAGDVIRIQASLNQSTNQAQANILVNKRLTLDLKITLDISSDRNMRATTYNHKRTSETPLNIRLQPQAQKTNTASISARLEQILPDESEKLLAQISDKNNFNVKLQKAVFNDKLIIDTDSVKNKNPAYSISRIVLIRAQMDMDALGVRTNFSPPTRQAVQDRVARAPISALTQRISYSTRLSQHYIARSPVVYTTPLQASKINLLPIRNTLKNNQFSVLNDFSKIISPPFTASQKGNQGSAAPISAPPLNVTQRAGYVTALVVGFTTNGSAIVRLPNYHAQTMSQVPAHPPLSGTAGSTSKTSTAATPNLNIWSTHNVVGDDLFLLRAPELNSIPLRIGTQIELAPQAYTQSTYAASDGTNFQTNPLTYFMNPGVWPALSESYRTLQIQAPALAQTMSNIVANPSGGASSTANIMPAALFFLSAIRSGDIQNWLGDKVMDELKRSGKNSLSARLGQEGQALGRLNAELLSQDWRAISLPFLDQGEIHKVALYYKQGEADDDGHGGKKRTRFVFDMALSRMGQVQVDGLFQGKKLDLILRTTNDLSPDMRHKMRGIYTDALESSGLNGNLSFQNRMKHYFIPKPKVDEFAAEF